MIATPADLLSAIATVLALVLFFYMGIRVAQMRGKHKIDAPKMTGPLEFECAVRVHMNTLEALVVFLPALWLATIYFRTLGWLPAALGFVWVIGRILYMTGYMEAPNKRSLGYGISTVALFALLLLAIWGVVQDWPTS
jgi:glutathione S-transferase